MDWPIGVSTGGCVDASILDVLDAVSRSSVRGVELGTPPRHFDPWRADDVRAVQARLERHGLLPVSIHAPFGGLLDLSDPNPHHRYAAVGGILTTASALKQLGGSILVVHTTDARREPHDVDERLQRCAECLHVVARACRQLGVTMAVESPLPHLVGGHPDEFAWLLTRLDDHVGVCLDTGHAALGRHWTRLVEIAGPRLVHVHANDTRGVHDDHLPPGEGIIDWAAIGSSLRAHAYRGWIVLELGCPDGPLDGYFTRAHQRAEALLG